jgi:hypothetical protein
MPQIYGDSIGDVARMDLAKKQLAAQKFDAASNRAVATGESLRREKLHEDDRIALDARSDKDRAALTEYRKSLKDDELEAKELDRLLRQQDGLFKDAKNSLDRGIIDSETFRKIVRGLNERFWATGEALADSARLDEDDFDRGGGDFVANTNRKNAKDIKRAKELSDQIDNTPADEAKWLGFGPNKRAALETERDKIIRGIADSLNSDLSNEAFKPYRPRIIFDPKTGSIQYSGRQRSTTTGGSTTGASHNATSAEEGGGPPPPPSSQVGPIEESLPPRAARSGALQESARPDDGALPSMAPDGGLQYSGHQEGGLASIGGGQEGIRPSILPALSSPFIGASEALQLLSERPPSIIRDNEGGLFMRSQGLNGKTERLAVANTGDGRLHPMYLDFNGKKLFLTARHEQMYESEYKRIMREQPGITPQQAQKAAMNRVANDLVEEQLSRDQR